MIWRVALDTPLRRLFDYLPAAGVPPGRIEPGVRVRVPFGRRQLVGVLVDVAQASDVPREKLKPATAILDVAPIVDRVTLELLRFAAHYYHHPLGAVIAAALPAALRKGESAADDLEVWSLTESGRAELAAPTGRRAPRQRALLEWLAQRSHVAQGEVLAAFRPQHLRVLVGRGWVVASRIVPPGRPFDIRPDPVTLTETQAAVIAAISARMRQFAAHVLDGVTGSGKTEVYLRVIAAALAEGGQALVLVPEIALTPQLVERFRDRFGTGVAVLHSALAGGERRDAWRAAHSGRARIVIGTRSAVFTSLPQLALIVVDEEHDASYKQHEGFRYSARDLAVWRARRARVPIILGSATPSLESLENVAQDRYSRHSLPQRPGAAQAPRLRLVDLRRHGATQGLSQPVLQAIDRHLAAGGQVIVFLNRRGYAPALFCDACGWVAPCAHCDARMTLHRRAAELRCHHCGAHGSIPATCGSCGHGLNAVGQGTERVEETLARLFPDAPLARLDRDTTAARGAMEAVLARVHGGEARILIGTQMLTKGHHFPEVSLVVILDADHGLFATDFRATERLAQTITQVAGRAGRATRPGEVLIQTQFPEHPLLTRLIDLGYEAFASSALEERRDAGWPPYSRLALLRAEARDTQRLDAFLQAAATAGGSIEHPAVKILGPAPALMARRADHFRAHLLVESGARAALHRFLTAWLPQIEALPGTSGLRWSIDVDPLELD